MKQMGRPHTTKRIIKTGYRREEPHRKRPRLECIQQIIKNRGHRSYVEIKMKSGQWERVDHSNQYLDLICMERE